MNPMIIIAILTFSYSYNDSFKNPFVNVIGGIHLYVKGLPVNCRKKFAAEVKKKAIPKQADIDEEEKSGSENEMKSQRPRSEDGKWEAKHGIEHLFLFVITQ